MEQSLSPTYLKFEMLEWHLLLTLSRRLRLQREIALLFVYRFLRDLVFPNLEETPSDIPCCRH